MDLSIVKQTSKRVGRVLSKNSPSILTGLGVFGLISTVTAAIKATPKAIEILEREAEFRRDEYSEQTGEDMFTPLEIVELTWKCYLPTVGLGLLTVGCMIGSNHINLRRNAALASLFSIAEASLQEYQAKVVEQLGEKKEEKIRAEIAQDHLDKHPIDEKLVVITGKGDHLFWDTFSGRYFRSDIETLRRVENTFNQRLLREMWLSINEFYYEIGLESIELGEEMGWIAERSLMELKTNTAKVTKDGEPCIILEYRVQPHHI